MTLGAAMKMLMLSLLLALFPLQLTAEPAPFGLILNKTTLEDLKNKFPVTAIGINKNNGLSAYDIDPKDIHFEGLLAARVAFSPDGILKMVQLSLPANKFTEILSSLASKYTLLYKNIPQDGNREAKFEKDNSYILLYAPQGSDEMDFLYSNKKILEDALQGATTLAANTVRESSNAEL